MSKQPSETRYQFGLAAKQIGYGAANGFAWLSGIGAMVLSAALISTQPAIGIPGLIGSFVGLFYGGKKLFDWTCKKEKRMHQKDLERSLLLNKNDAHVTVIHPATVLSIPRNPVTKP